MNTKRCAGASFLNTAVILLVIALFAASCGGGDDSTSRQRNAAGQSEECGPEGTLVSSNPTIPDTSAPAASDTSAPAASDTSAPAAPDTSAPAAPDTSAPAAPDTSAPAAPDVTSSTTPDVTSSTTPDVTSSTTPDVTSSTTPDVTSSTTSSTAPPMAPPTLFFVITPPEDLGVTQVEARRLGLSYWEHAQIDEIVVDDPDYDHLGYWQFRVSAYLEDHPEVAAKFREPKSEGNLSNAGSSLDKAYEDSLDGVDSAKKMVKEATSESEKQDALAVYSSAKSEAGALAEAIVSAGSPNVKKSGAVEDPCASPEILVAPPIDIDDDTTAGIPPTVIIVEDPVLEIEETVEEIVVTPEAAEQMVAACDVTAGTLEIKAGDNDWQMVTPGEAEAITVGTKINTIQVRVTPVDKSQPALLQVIEIQRAPVTNLLSNEELATMLAQLAAQRPAEDNGLPLWPFMVIAGLLLILILLLLGKKKPDLVITFDLMGDYAEWKRVFDEDLLERSKFSDRMVTGSLENNQVAILAYDVDVKAMQSFMGSTEFKERTSAFHSEPEIYQMSKLTRDQKLDLVITFDLMGDYAEWKRVFDEDLLERSKFSDRMVTGLLENNQVAILGYGVDVKAMQSFMGSTEFKERTKRFHSEPQISKLGQLKRTK
jgi:hypothetical protein